MEFIKCCLPLLVTLLVLVQHTGATSKQETAMSVIRKSLSPSVADIIEYVTSFLGYKQESQFIGLVLSVIEGGVTGFAAGHIIGAVIGAGFGGVKWLFWDILFDIVSNAITMGE